MWLVLDHHDSLDSVSFQRALDDFRNDPFWVSLYKSAASTSALRIRVSWRVTQPRVSQFIRVRERRRPHFQPVEIGDGGGYRVCAST